MAQFHRPPAHRYLRFRSGLSGHQIDSRDRTTVIRYRTMPVSLAYGRSRPAVERRPARPCLTRAWHGEAMSLPFSSRTVGRLISAINLGYTGATIGTLLLEAGADDWAPDQWPNKSTRLQDVFNNLKQSKTRESEKAALELARLVVVAGSRASHAAFSVSEPTIWRQGVVDALATDGSEAKNELLVPSVPGMRTTEELTWVETFLKRRGWGTSVSHYHEAIDSFSSGNWASTNSQLRSFLEDLMALRNQAGCGLGPGQHAGLS